MSELETLQTEAQSSLSRIQNFNLEDLIQSERLGALNFKDVVEPAKKLITLFKQLPASTLPHFPTNQLQAVKDQSNNVHQLFEQVLGFDVNEGDVNNRKTQVISKIRDAYQGTFTQLFPLISYSMARTVDFNQLEEQGRATVQEIKDQTNNLMGEIREQKTEAGKILDDVRKTAAEQGVSQEAFYFKDEADRHNTDAAFWRRWTIWMSIAVAIYGGTTLFLHKIPFLTPVNVYETVQFSIGKLLVFFVLAYMLSLCARNFMSNRHNEIVNRHRQNALMTYKALVDAGELSG